MHMHYYVFLNDKFLLMSLSKKTIRLFIITQLLTFLNGRTSVLILCHINSADYQNPVYWITDLHRDDVEFIIMEV